MLGPILPSYLKARLSGSEPPEIAPPGWPKKIVPNFSQWRLGDIVLVETDGSAIGTTIVSAQRASLRPRMRAGANFTHAALYVGEGKVIDMTLTSNISERSVWDYCQDRQIAVRREPSLSSQDEQDIVDYARNLMSQNLQYSVMQTVLTKVFPVRINQNRLFCSSFVGLCFAAGPMAARNLDHDVNHQPLYPGTLYGHANLNTVQLEWRTSR